MPYGIIGVPGVGPDNATPSPTIWGDCLDIALPEQGQGFYVDRRFDTSVTLPDLPNVATNSGTFTQDAAFDRACLLTTGTTANNDLVAFTRPYAAIAPGSGIKTWFETSISFQDVTEVNGVFVGLVNKPGMAAGLIKAASGTKNSNLLTSVASTSCVGFWMHGDALGNFDAVVVNNVANTNGVTPTAITTVLASVMTSPANNPDPGNPLYTPSAAPGVLTNNTKVKLGVLYDGQQYVKFFVNGVQVAKLAVSAATFDTLSTYGGVVTLATGAAAAHHMDLHMFRTAAKLF